MAAGMEVVFGSGREGAKVDWIFFGGFDLFCTF